MKYTQLTPCAECPFRKKSLPGWLGPDTDPQKLINNIMGRIEIPGQPGVFVGGEPMDFACHCHTDKIVAKHGTDAKGRIPKRHVGKVQHCVGALLFLSAINKLPHDREKVAAMDAARATEPMIETEAEFVRHHKGTPTPAAQAMHDAIMKRRAPEAAPQPKPGRPQMTFGKADKARKK